MKALTLTAIILAAAAANASATPGIFKPKQKNPEPAKTEQTQQSPAEKILSLRENLQGEWTISLAGNTTVKSDDDQAPYINFSTGDSKFYANNGCNVINGVYTINSRGDITFNSTMATMRYCPETGTDTEISAVLNDGVTVTPYIQQLGQDTYLVLSNAKGQPLLTLKKHNMEFLDGNWKITAIRGIPLTGDQATIFFDITEQKVHGNTGCNFFNGTIFIDPTRTNAIDLSNMGLTRRACPEFQQEQAIMLALEETTTAIQGNADQAILLDNQGNTLLTLQRIPRE